jgi:hypothetical protein
VEAALATTLTAWLLYPLTAVACLSFVTSRRWLTSTVLGLVAFVVLMALIPSNFDVFDIGLRVARPLCAYLGGLVTTGLALAQIKAAKRPR